MKPIYIFGCSGFAVEVAQIIDSLDKFEIRGFIDKDENINSPRKKIRFNKIEVPVIGQSEFQKILKSSPESIPCAIAIANGEICKKIYDEFGRYCQFPNIISPEAVINDTKIEGVGNIIFNDCIISWKVVLGSFNKILPFVTIGHESIIGDFNEFNPKVSISGKTNIGNGNLFGVGSMIIQGKKVEDNNCIGMGAVVIRNVKSNGTWFGNPAKILHLNE